MRIDYPSKLTGQNHFGKFTASVKAWLRKNGGINESSYDLKTDILSVIFREDAIVTESDEDKPGVILDYDAKGNLISLEILDASTRVSDTRKIEFQMTG